MAVPTTDTGTGTTITFGTSTFTATVIEINPSVGRPAVDDTGLSDTGGRSYIPGDLTDGEVTLKIAFKQDEEIPFSDPETITITYPGGTSSATDVFTGFITDASKAIAVDELLTADITIKVASAVAFTAAS